jgi:hypothetical protein
MVDPFIYIIYAVLYEHAAIFSYVLFDDRHDDRETYLQYPFLLV